MTEWHQHLRLALVTLVLGVSVWLGLADGIDDLRSAESDGQRVAAGLQILYGLAATTCLIALFLRPRWVRPALIVWAFALTATAALAPVVWGGAAWWSGVLSGGSALLIAAIVCRSGLAHVRTKATRP